MGLEEAHDFDDVAVGDVLVGPDDGFDFLGVLDGGEADFQLFRLVRRPLIKIFLSLVISISRFLTTSSSLAAFEVGSEMSIRRGKSTKAVDTMKKMRSKNTTSMRGVSSSE